PRPRNTRLTVALTFDEACRIVRSERLPRLVPCHVRQRTIAVQRRGIATLQPAKEKSRRRQRFWKDLAQYRISAVIHRGRAELQETSALTTVNNCAGARAPQQDSDGFQDAIALSASSVFPPRLARSANDQ